MLKCIICGKEKKDNYLGGIRNFTRWGSESMICGECYNKGYEDKK